MIVHAIRHGQSLTNAGVETSLNSNLSPFGLRQVERLAERFGGMRVRAIYSSPLHRCLQTARPIADALGLPICVRSELFEFHGLPPGSSADLALPPPAEFAARSDGIRLDPDFPPSAEWPQIDETREDMIERTRSMTRFLMTRWPAPDDVVLVISHGSPIARMIDAWLSDHSGPSFRFVIENATLNTVRFEEGVRSLMRLNDATHLVGLDESELRKAAEAW